MYIDLYSRCLNYNKNVLKCLTLPKVYLNHIPFDKSSTSIKSMFKSY